MEIRASVNIPAPAEHVWAVFTNNLQWQYWYGVEVSFNTWNGGRSITFAEHDGIAETECPISGYVEGETLTIDGKFGSDTYTVRPDGEGCEFSRTARFRPGMSMPPAAQEKQSAQWKDNWSVWESWSSATTRRARFRKARRRFRTVSSGTSRRWRNMIFPKASPGSGKRPSTTARSAG